MTIDKVTITSHINAYLNQFFALERSQLLAQEKTNNNPDTISAVVTTVPMKNVAPNMIS